MRTIKRISAMAVAVLVMMTAALGCVIAHAEYIRYCSAPRASVASGVYTSNMYVKLSCTTTGARIFYTTDNSTPTIYSTEYKTPIRVRGKKGESVTTIIRAIAVKTGYEDSEVAEYAYKIEIPLDLEVEYMEIQKTPNKTRYKKGEELNLTGGKIIVSYEDGTYGTLDMTPSMISGFNTDTAGEKEITVTYKGFTDSFKIQVSKSGNISDDEYYDYYEPEDEAERPRLSGTTVSGWGDIKTAFDDMENCGNAVVMLNEAVSVPSEVLRAAAKNELKLTFMADNEMKWKLDAATINIETVPSIGLGLRTNAISMLETPIKALGGTEAVRFHVNSDNKLNAQLCMKLGTEHGGRFASLYSYNNGSLRLVDTQIPTKQGYVEFTPDTSGDYVVITDNETKILGDLDNNMRVDAMDASKLLHIIVYGGDENVKQDFDKNGVVNALDVSAILKFVVG